jgi:pSer/pThr/pTyr-binding forkhead associated (FHA) protein
MAQLKAGGAPKKPTTATGGRVVSLVDGREYPVADAGLTFGREVGNDVVIASTEISRKHASIMPDVGGYVITDHSTNGVWVNGSGSPTAAAGARGRDQDGGRGVPVLRGCGEGGRRRRCAPVADHGARRRLARGTGPAPSRASRRPPPAGPSSRLPLPRHRLPRHRLPRAPAPAAPVPAAPAPKRAPLATLEVITGGPLKGLTFEIHSALTNIGRGEHNDVALPDESVSDSHAKIQKRADGWWIVDQGSTNGTYVGGRRVRASSASREPRTSGSAASRPPSGPRRADGRRGRHARDRGHACRCPAQGSAESDAGAQQGTGPGPGRGIEEGMRQCDSFLRDPRRRRRGTAEPSPVHGALT